jgi:hypothetical protein
MADQLGSARFRAIFESALQAYENKAGLMLAKHPLAVQLQSCQSLESTIAVMQGQAQAFGEFQGIDRVMKSIRSIVSILTRLSTSASLSDSIGLVRQKALMVCSIALTIFHSNSHLRLQSTLALLSYSLYVWFYSIYVRIFVTSR